MPGGVVCSVAICKNNSKKSKEVGANLMFFTFPKDPKIQKQWITKCYRKDKWSCVNKRICSNHFRIEDYEDSLQARLLNLQPTKLKKDAIPSLFLLPNEEEVKEISIRSKRMARKETKAVADVVMSSNAKEEPVNIPTQNLDLSEIPLSSKESDLDVLKRKVNQLEKENVILKQKIQENEETEKYLKAVIRELETVKLKSESEFEENAKHSFKDFLTPNQIEIALKKKTKARWSQEELSRAFTLRYFSKRAYIYLRKTLHYPLPGISTLQQWAANINVSNGILEDILRIMNISAQNKPHTFPATVLSFDEFKVCSTWEYYQKNDEVLGPHSYMQVIMARGLFDQWKQPVYIGFDKKMTQNLLQNVIEELHKINYNVAACTSDCGGGNQGLWAEMGVSVKKNFIEHPVTRKPIYFFADVPHLLKLVRNWFVDTGFILHDGSVINKNPVNALINSTRSEINSCYKLTPLHVNCEKTRRQNVKLAAQLFSNTTATALKQYLPGNDKSAAATTGEFIQTINNWFDLMNSYTPFPSIPTKEPYGKRLKEQDELLNDVSLKIGKMLCIGKQSLQVFQKGILMTNRSLKGLLTTMKNEYKIDYIMTHRLNQDCLENFFCQLRTRGGLHDHPSPLNIIYRIRMILLGKNPGLVTVNANIQDSPGLPDEEYLLARALKQAKLVNIKLDEDIDETLEVHIGSDKSSTTTDASTTKNDSEADGLIYIAGFLAKKHNKKYPNLGQYTHQAEEINFHNYSRLPSFLKNLSFGGLTEPSEDWKKQVFEMNTYFQHFHMDSFTKTKDIVKETVDYVSHKVQNVPKELVRSFCRQRIFVRINFLNMKREELKQQKRKASNDDHHKVTKKMKKVVN